MRSRIYHSLLLFFVSLPTLAAPILPLTIMANASTLTFKKGQIVANNGIIYRKIVGITNKGYYQVQNFYCQTKNKQTDVFIIKDPQNLSLLKSLEIYNQQNLIFDGVLTLWFDNGNKFMTFTIIEGKGEGAFASYYITGTQEITGQYKAGKPEGLWLYWNKEGNLERKVYYKAGLRQWQKEIFNLKGF